MKASPWEQTARQVLEESAILNLHRDRRELIPWDATHVRWQGRRLVNFASNDYLGLAHHPKVIHAAQKVLAQQGAGSGASPLICGYTPVHAAAERAIANWKGTESSVLLPSGYQANLAAVQTLAVVATRAEKKIRFLLDKLCHASLIDAVAASGRPFRVFPHNGLVKLSRLLRESPADEMQIVVTEAIFSMEGDAADLAGLAKLKHEHEFLLLLDEAHSSGVYGVTGSGLASELGLSDAVDVTIVTLSKAVGCVGGAVCGSEMFCEALVNFARAYIYSTSIPAHIAAAARGALQVMRQEPLRQQRVRILAKRVRDELSEAGFHVPRGDSPIIPVILGTEEAAMRASDFLLARNILTLAIRPPTVPRNSSRLRFTLSSEHSDEEIERLINVVNELGC